MGYEVNVNGTITFHDIDGFKEAFEKIAQRRTSEVGSHGDFDYFFTKMWGDYLENLNAMEGKECTLSRQGKLWFDDEKAMKLLSKFASGKVTFSGEDGYRWEFTLDGKGQIARQDW